jgi:transposase
VHRWVLRLSQTGVFERLAHTPHRCASRPLGWRGEAGKRGDDPAWRVVGRKRHALMGMVGRPLMAAVSPADLHDSHGVIALRRASRGLFPFLACCFADRAYRGARVGVDTTITVEIVKPKTGQKGFTIQPRRWVIERSFGWIARDHKATPSSALAFVVLPTAMILVRQIARGL